MIIPGDLIRAFRNATDDYYVYRLSMTDADDDLTEVRAIVVATEHPRRTSFGTFMQKGQVIVDGNLCDWYFTEVTQVVTVRDVQ